MIQFVNDHILLVSVGAYFAGMMLACVIYLVMPHRVRRD